MGNDVKTRVAELRKSLKLKQAEFAEKLGLTNASISAIEIGKNPLTEQNVKLICLVFGVNETWLRNGIGPMFIEEVPGEKQLREAFRTLSPDGRKLAIKLIYDLLEAQTERETLSPAPADK
jgi:transcriptional regulator with XRE-family HTH domain